MATKIDAGHLQFTLQRRHQKQIRALIVAVMLVALLVVLGLQAGSYQSHSDGLWSLLLSKLQQQSLSQSQQIQWYIFSELRAPRMLMAMCVGALLAMSGCAMQGLVRNPLADPGLIGISAGAAAAAASALAMINHFPQFAAGGYYLVTLCAFAGALVAVWLVIYIARSANGMAISTIILAGVAVNALATTHIGAISYMANDDALRQITYWTMGSLGGITWPKVTSVVVLFVPAMWLFMHLRKPLNMLALGENEAQCMGLAVSKYKTTILWLVALSVALATALCGIIGFVGLVVPHIARTIFGADHKYLMPACGALGAVLVTGADIASRVLFPPLEIPIGIVTSAVGAPFFLYLLAKHKAGDTHA